MPWLAGRLTIAVHTTGSPDKSPLAHHITTQAATAAEVTKAQSVAP